MAVGQGAVDHPMLLTRGDDGKFSSALAPREGDDGWRHTGVIAIEKDGKVYYRGFSLNNALQIGGGSLGLTANLSRSCSRGSQDRRRSSW